MPIVCFRGRVLPSMVEFTFTDIPTAQWKWEEENLLLGFSVRINKSKVEVECDLGRYEDSFFGEIHRRSLDLARACVNVGCFSTGLGATVFLEEFVDPNGNASPFYFNSPHLVAECTAFKMNPVALDDKKLLEKILAMVMSEPALFMALNDLVQSISVPNIGPTNCGRVLDGLRKLVTSGIEPKQGWPIFQATIQSDAAYLSFISEHSKKPRHGEHVRIDGITTTEIIRRTWVIMNRFLEYRKRGNQPLPLAEFPLLVG